MTVRHFLDGRMDVLFKERSLAFTTFAKLPGATAIEDDKTIDARLDQIIAQNALGKHRTPPPGPVDGSGYEGPDPTTAPLSQPRSTTAGDISTLHR